MTARPPERGLGAGIGVRVKAITCADAVPNRRRRKPPGEEFGRRHLQGRLTVRGTQQGGAEPNPAKTGNPLTMRSEPWQHKEGPCGMGKNPGRPEGPRGKDRFDEPGRFGNEGHVSAGPIRSSVPRPVEPHGAITGPDDLGGRPVVTTTVIAEPVQNQNGATIDRTWLPLPQENAPVDGPGIEVGKGRSERVHPACSPRPENIPVADGSPIAYFRRPSREGEFARLAQG